MNERFVSLARPGSAASKDANRFVSASTNGNSDLLALLTAHGARRSLFDAIALADTNLLASLLAAEPGRANETNRSFSSALLYATDVGNAQVVRQLLASGANPDLANTPFPKFFLHQFVPGTVPLHLAVWSNRMDMAEMLVSAKANVSTVNEQGFTALHFAAARGLQDMAAWLLAHGADPNAQLVATNTASAFPGISHMSPFNQMNPGWTPLHLAVRYGHPALVELLVAKGAKLEATDAQGRTPADLTQRNFGMMNSPWPPAPYRGLAAGMPISDASRDPARNQAVADVLKKLGAIIPTTRGPIFINRVLPPGFPIPPQPPTAPLGVPPAPKK